MPISDEKLVKLVQKGNTDEYEKLVTRYQEKLYRYLVYLTREPDESEDLLQDTFIAVYKNIHKFNTKLKFSSWIYRIAHNNAINYLKKSSKTLSFDFLNLGNILAKEDKTLEKMENEETKEMVRKCLDKLPNKYKSPLVLFYFEDKTYQEISDILRISTNNVGVLINRGKKSMKELCKI
ncbi:RNA polymerase sigma factor [Patescibacteria group bacterium]|nr:RNA polymerase sigma factor [Patescibacteria group bacterium]MBU0777067.1 RNA polymerase sigma factor [Patescibacteria group bacterium]MBU0845761.1 RNA polymerase sigma factor [Patescibacteria group bacterium]MBU0923189.1 RNA polymerase sigma factor [Patescibacteria group bacterium]MBU1066479.1 RNA polymerase sigma factor [Patescibacteria group bacterium]